MSVGLEESSVGGEVGVKRWPHLMPSARHAYVMEHCGRVGHDASLLIATLVEPLHPDA